MTDTDYKVLRSKRRTVALEVALDGSFTVRCPLKCTDREIAKFVEQHQSWIEKTRLRQLNRAADRPKEPTEEETKALKQKAKAVIPERVRYFEQLTGLRSTSVKITSARTRFGSCSMKNGLCFSYRLLLYPDDAVDYVIIHELCHTVHHNHSQKFWDLVERIMPDYKTRKKLLK
ncbi:MAG: M48 family metallopeptidase [Ruminococcaceae bacterium]|nr:M48 family metallopeptidase [Oscillospiraceae bacterium]